MTKATIKKKKIMVIFPNDNKLTFTKLIPSNSREDKVYTFIPLLHLTNQRRIDLEQEKHFGEIEVYLKTKKAVDKEIGKEIGKTETSESG